MNKPEDCLLTRPKHVAIVAMGLSNRQFIISMTCQKDIENWPDEIWGINFIGGCLRCDKIFLMDGMTYLSSVGWKHWTKWMKKYDTPIIQPKAEKRFQNTVRYPIEQVAGFTQELRELTHTPCYAIAYAIAIGVKRLDLFGFDYDYTPSTDARNKAGILDEDGHKLIVKEEDGRDAASFWCGIARGKGMMVNAVGCRLLNSSQQLYGYKENGLNIKKVFDN